MEDTLPDSGKPNPGKQQPEIEPLQTYGLADYHVHCDYSIDAVGSIDEYCEAAVRKGLVEICFTTHYDSNPDAGGRAEFIRVNGEKLPTSIEHLKPYVDDVMEARDKYFPYGLVVKLGLEFGWYPGCEKEADRVRNAFEFEHFLCGIHELENICFCCRDNFEKCFDRYSVEQMVAKYADNVVAASDTRLFTAIAHLDYVRKYGVGYYGEQLDEVIRREAEARIFPALIKNGTPLEVNTSGMRRGLKEYFPSVSLVNAARRAGVNVYFLGSDAHEPQHVGWDFDAAAPLASMASVRCELD
ncbi:histidinol-phosphatase HisJ family protein [candidate division GN15 bacterium]|nr:histidinol-phosphatase HisJ family protein [candidate division GN15 bacterium]